MTTPAKGAPSNAFIENLSSITSTLEQNLKCPICLDTIQDAYANPDCMHRFCGPCILRHLEKCNKHCPTCRTHIGTKRTLRKDNEFDEMKSNICNMIELVKEEKKSSPISRTTRTTKTTTSLSTQMNILQSESDRQLPQQSMRSATVSEASSSSDSDIEIFESMPTPIPTPTNMPNSTNPNQPNVARRVSAESVQEDTQPNTRATIVNTSTSTSRNNRIRRAPTNTTSIDIESTDTTSYWLSSIPHQMMTEDLYANLEELMTEFCKLPNLSTFIQPFVSLHPDQEQLYSQIISEPSDLSQVCRNIQRRQYRYTGTVCRDISKIFDNMITYYNHPSTKEEDSLVAFFNATHLQRHFMSLWCEHMIPSDLSTSNPIHASAIEVRAKIRATYKAYLEPIKLSSKCLETVAQAITKFVSSAGKVDRLDKTVIPRSRSKPQNVAMTKVYQNLAILKEKLLRMRLKMKDDDYTEYTMKQLERDLDACYDANTLPDNLEHLRTQVKERVDRLIGKICLRIAEVLSRGMPLSRVGGHCADLIWARLNKDKPFFPAMVLGILSANHRKEKWQSILNSINEARLPQTKRKALVEVKEMILETLDAASTKRDQKTFFLVETLGSHDFMWVSQSDIDEIFCLPETPNGDNGPRNLRNRPNEMKAYELALKEAVAVQEELEKTVLDPCAFCITDHDEDATEQSFAALCLSATGEGEEADTAERRMTRNKPNGNRQLRSGHTHTLSGKNQLPIKQVEEATKDRNGRKSQCRMKREINQLGSEPGQQPNAKRRRSSNKARKRIQ